MVQQKLPGADLGRRKVTKSSVVLDTMCRFTTAWQSDQVVWPSMAWAFQSQSLSALLVL